MTDFCSVRLEVRKTVKPRHQGELVDLLNELGLVTSSQEQLWVIALDAVNAVRSVTPVAMGTYHDSFVALPTIFAPVFLAATDRFIIAHNHPAGRARPTKPDLDLTARVQAAATVLDVEFHDHIIVCPDGSWTSLNSAGYMKEAA